MVRLIRSDLKLNIFGECFSAPPETMLEYVVATIDVKEQKLKLFLDNKQVTDFDYKLRLNQVNVRMSWHGKPLSMSWHSTITVLVIHGFLK